MTRPAPQLTDVRLEKLHPTQITVGRAKKLAQSQQARYLPGWCGVIEPV